MVHFTRLRRSRSGQVAIVGKVLAEECCLTAKGALPEWTYRVADVRVIVRLPGERQYRAPGTPSERGKEPHYE